MYRVMIVDDEPLILAGIISMLNWEAYECKIVGKATNGKQALEKLNEFSPDIIITDIKMPAMDGIEFIQKAKEQGSEATFILLSNLEEFKLVKKAITLGAIDYLVKLELTEDILLKSLKKAIDICKNNRILKKSNEDNQISEITVDEMILNYFKKLLIYNTDSMDIEDVPIYILDRFKDTVIIMINLNYRHELFSMKVDTEEQKRIMAYAENVLNEMVKRFFKYNCLIRMGENGFILIVSTYQIDEYRNYIENIGKKIISILKDYFELSVSIAVSKKDTLIYGFENLIYQVNSAMNYYYYDSSNEIIFYSEECDIYKQCDNKLNTSSLKKYLSLAIHQNDSIKFQEIMDQFMNTIKENKPSKAQVINGCSNIYYFITSFYEDDEEIDFAYVTNIAEELNKFRSLDNVIKWIMCFSNEIVKIMKKKKINKSDKFIELAQRYIKENHKEKISLSKVADDLSISSGYLSSIFKKQTGSTFSDYVSEIKVEKAKELIETHHYMMYEVSDILGFDNPYYFSKVFKKITGYTPKEYEVVSLKNKSKS